MTAWTDDELVVLCDRYPTYRAQDIADELGRAVSSVYAKAHSLGLRKSASFLDSSASGRIGSTGSRCISPWAAWTDEQLKVLRARYPHERTVDVAAAVGRSVNSCYARAKTEGLRKTAAFLSTPDSGRTDGRRGLSSRFLPGHVPANKGKKLAGIHPNSAATQFQKGHRRNDTASIGDMRRETKDKYWLVKVCNDCKPQHRWKPLHRIVWERSHGPVPPNHVISIKHRKRDEPPEAVTVDRLECISKAENCRRNSIHNLPQPIKAVIMQKGRLTREINKQRQAHEEQY